MDGPSKRLPKHFQKGLTLFNPSQNLNVQPNCVWDWNPDDARRQSPNMVDGSFLAGMNDFEDAQLDRIQRERSSNQWERNALSNTSRYSGVRPDISTIETSAERKICTKNGGYTWKACNHANQHMPRAEEPVSSLNTATHRTGATKDMAMSLET